MTPSAPRGGLHPEIAFPYEQEWELYHNTFSLCSKKVRVCMAELGLPHRRHHVHLIETGKYETCSRAFLKLNPAGTVPLLLHEGHPIYESHEQIAYAAAHADARGKELLPEDPEARKIVEFWTDCASLVGDPIRGSAERAGHCIPGLTLPLFAAMVAEIPFREILKGLLTHPNRERPLLFAMLKLRTLHGLPRLGAAMRLLHRSRRHMGVHLDALAGTLDAHGGPWIAGDTFTLADISWVVILDRLDEADWSDFFWGRERRPTVARYWERLRGRPSYQSQILELRCPMTRVGIAHLSAAKQCAARLREALEAETGR